MNAISTTGRATLQDLAQVSEKAELIGGSIVRIMPTGYRPNRIAGRIFRSLATYADENSRGEAFTDGMGFSIPELPSGRESFSPDASFCTAPPPPNPMRFIEAAPDFAVEVRSENDYDLAQKSNSPRNATTISPPEPKWFGMSIRKHKSSFATF